MRKYRLGLGKNKNGNIFPVNIFVNYFFDIGEEFAFSGLLLKIKTDAQFLLLDSNFMIMDICERFQSLLGLKDVSLVQNTHIKLFFP
jgi:hypothetical protein